MNQLINIIRSGTIFVSVFRYLISRLDDGQVISTIHLIFLKPIFRLSHTSHFFTNQNQLPNTSNERPGKDTTVNTIILPIETCEITTLE